MSAPVPPPGLSADKAESSLAPPPPQSVPVTRGPPATVTSSIVDPRPSLPDPDKPQMPYAVGRQFTAFHHKAPHPMMLRHDQVTEPLPSQFQTMTQLAFCVGCPARNAPLLGQTFHFTITREVAVEDGRGSQVFLVNDSLVAKIFDPLYYYSVFRSGLRPHVVNIADYHHSREVAAYQELNGILGGGVIPKFYGSWSLYIPTPTPAGCLVIRTVHMILIEYLAGLCMNNLLPSCLTAEMRLNIMTRVVEADIELVYHGVRQGDLAPRNVMLLEDPQEKDFRLVIIDFNHAVVSRLEGEHVMKHDLPKPLSPVRWHRYHGHLDAFADARWLPGRQYQRWLEAVFAGSDRYLDADWKCWGPRMRAVAPAPPASAARAREVVRGDAAGGA
jgi:hypothetical protein